MKVYFIEGIIKSIIKSLIVVCNIKNIPCFKMPLENKQWIKGYRLLHWPKGSALRQLII